MDANAAPQVTSIGAQCCSSTPLTGGGEEGVRDPADRATGRLVPLDEQNRTVWDWAVVEEGLMLLDLTTPRCDTPPRPALLQGWHCWPACSGSGHRVDGLARDPRALRAAQALGKGPEPERSRDATARWRRWTSSPPITRGLPAQMPCAHLLEEGGRTTEAFAAYTRGHRRWMERGGIAAVPGGLATSDTRGHCEPRYAGESFEHE